MSRYMNVEECAAYIGLAPRTLYKKSHYKQIPVRKHGSKLFFDKEEIDAWSLSRARPVEEKTKPLSKFQDAASRHRVKLSKAV